MSSLVIPVKAGLHKSSRVILMLTKIIVPVSCIVVAMKYFNILEPLALFFAPAMALLGLPGEAALVLVFGFFSSVYAAIGVMTTLSLTPAEITTLAIMIGISHELFIESAIASHTGLKMPAAMALRISASIVAGITLNVIFNVVLGV
jgi:hypothetical protein